MSSFLSLNAKAPYVKTLIVFSGSGTLASSWLSWDMNFPNVRVLIAEYPGRGINTEKPIETDFLKLSNYYQTALQPYLKEPCVFLGYSFGGYLACEIAQQLEITQKIIIERIFLAGVSDYSHYSVDKLKMISLADPELLKELFKENIAENEKQKTIEERDSSISILLNDIKMLSYYEFKAYKLQSPLSIYNGADDNFCHHQNASLRWKSHSEKIEYFTYAGGHRLTDKAKTLIKNHIGRHLEVGTNAPS